MWGNSGRYFWGRKEKERSGVVVVFAWMFSQEKHLQSYVRLYSSLNWNCIVCQSGFLNLFLPRKSERFALEILSELVMELQINPCPIVFAPFSGGSKASLYNILQIIEGKSESRLNNDSTRLICECISGYIYDSSPIDFVSDMGKKLMLHPSVIKTSQPPKILSWVVNGVSLSLDSMFSQRFEAQRADYWETLYGSVSLEAPYLIIASENDDLSSYKVIYDFAGKIRDRGGDVKLLTMEGSPHVGHFRVFPNEYTAAVTELLCNATAVYSRRRRQGIEDGSPGVSGTGNHSDERCLRRISAAPAPAEHLAEMECFESEHDEGFITVDESSNLFYDDVYAPRNVEHWDFESLSSLRKRPIVRSVDSFKSIRRSRL